MQAVAVAAVDGAMDQGRSQIDTKTLRYVADMLKELERMLPPASAGMLPYLIGMAQLEAERQVREQR